MTVKLPPNDPRDPIRTLYLVSQQVALAMAGEVAYEVVLCNIESLTDRYSDLWEE